MCNIHAIMRVWDTWQMSFLICNSQWWIFLIFVVSSCLACNLQIFNEHVSRLYVYVMFWSINKTWLQERVKKLKKDHGNVELGKITVDMVIILLFFIDIEFQVSSSIKCCPTLFSVILQCNLFLEVHFLSIKRYLVEWEEWQLWCG